MTVTVTSWAASYDQSLITTPAYAMVGLEVSQDNTSFTRIGSCQVSGNGTFRVSAPFPCRYARAYIDTLDSRISAGTFNVWVAGSGLRYGTAVVTPAFARGTAAQLSDLSSDYMVYLTVGTAGTAMTIAIGPTSTPANTIVPSSVATAGQMYSFRLPAGWYVQWSATAATLVSQLAIGC
jgi:hypothetical protein